MTDVTTECVDQRVSVYGDPVDTFERIALIWSAILDTKVHAWQVPLLQLGLKLVRVAEAPDYSDNSDDIEGYLDIFRKLIGDDMVQARSVVEYLEKKGKAHEASPSTDGDRTPSFGLDDLHTKKCWYSEADSPCICDDADGELIANPARAGRVS